MLRVLALLLLSGCAHERPRIVLIQHPLVRVDEPPAASKPKMTTTDEFTEWCPHGGCEKDDKSFRADKAPETKGADAK